MPMRLPDGGRRSGQCGASHMPSTRALKAEPPGTAPGSADPVLPFRDSEVLRSILDAAPMRVTYLDSRRRYRFANREF